MRQAAGADQTPRPAGFVEAPKPAAESRRVLLPTGACGRAQELRRISAQQFVCLHRQRPQPVARAFEQRGQRAVRPGDLHPQRLLLRGIQQQASVGGPLLPGSSGKALPIENLGRGPRGQPLGSSCLMEAGGQRARGAVAGRDHHAALAQPCVNLVCGQGSHFVVILRWAASVPCAVAEVESMMNEVRRRARRRQRQPKARIIVVWKLRAIFRF